MEWGKFMYDLSKIMEKDAQTIVLAIPDEVLMNKIYLIRGQKMMTDSDSS